MTSSPAAVYLYIMLMIDKRAYWFSTQCFSFQKAQNVLAWGDGIYIFTWAKCILKKEEFLWHKTNNVSASAWQTVPSLRYNVMDMNTYTHKYTLSRHPGPFYPKGGCYGAAIVQRLAWVKRTKTNLVVPSLPHIDIIYIFIDFILFTHAIAQNSFSSV